MITILGYNFCSDFTFVHFVHYVEKDANKTNHKLNTGCSFHNNLYYLQKINISINLLLLYICIYIYIEKLY